MRRTVFLRFPRPCFFWRPVGRHVQEGDGRPRHRASCPGPARDHYRHRSPRDLDSAPAALPAGLRCTSLQYAASGAVAIRSWSLRGSGVWAPPMVRPSAPVPPRRCRAAVDARRFTRGRTVRAGFCPAGADSRDSSEPSPIFGLCSGSARSCAHIPSRAGAAPAASGAPGNGRTPRRALRPGDHALPNMRGRSGAGGDPPHESPIPARTMRSTRPGRRGCLGHFGRTRGDPNRGGGGWRRPSGALSVVEGRPLSDAAVVLGRFGNRGLNIFGSPTHGGWGRRAEAIQAEVVRIRQARAAGRAPVPAFVQLPLPPLPAG